MRNGEGFCQNRNLPGMGVVYVRLISSFFGGRSSFNDTFPQITRFFGTTAKVFLLVEYAYIAQMYSFYFLIFEPSSLFGRLFPPKSFNVCVISNSSALTGIGCSALRVMGIYFIVAWCYIITWGRL